MSNPVVNKKNERGEYVKVEPVDPTTHPKDPPFSEIDLDKLTKQQMLILFRETRNLLIESARGLLNPGASVSFERCMKLTKELKKEELAYLASLEDEQLDKLK